MTDEPEPQPPPWSPDQLGRQWFGAILLAIGVVLACIALVQWQAGPDEGIGSSDESRREDTVDHVVLALIGVGLVVGGTVLIIKGRDEP